jgi:hypothetical protein
VVPPKRIVDSLPASETVYLTDAKLVAAGIAGMGATPDPKLIFLGPSNVTSAFRPDELMPLFPGLEVHQLSLGFHNLTHVKLEARLLTETLPDEVLRKTTFAIGVWYGAFVENGRPKLFDMESVFLRTGLFRRAGSPGVSEGGASSIVPIAGPGWLPLWQQLLRPFHFAQWLVESRAGTYRPHLFDRFVNAPAQGNEKELSLQSLEDSWIGRPDRSLSEQQFEELLALARMLSGKGAEVVIVDMALPRWHTEHASYLPAYAAMKGKYWPELQKLERTRIVDLTQAEELLPDETYFDLNHVTLDASRLWAQALRARWSPSAH